MLLPNIVNFNIKKARKSTTAKAMKETDIFEVKPVVAFLAINKAEVPNSLIPTGIIVSCFEFKAPCIIPLKTLEEPRVTIKAGSWKYPINKPLKAPSKAPIAIAIKMGNQTPPS
jgi:hypothetical protein